MIIVRQARSESVGSCLRGRIMAEQAERRWKYPGNIRNPPRVPEHYVLYKELDGYFDRLHNIHVSNVPSHLHIPQPTLSLPITSSSSHRTVFAPLDLRYIPPPLSASSSTTSSSKTGGYSNVPDANQGPSADLGANESIRNERDSLPSDALRNLYRLAERVYAHLNVGMEEKESNNGTNSSGTGFHLQPITPIRDQPIENTARPAARDGSVIAPGRYHTEIQVIILVTVFLVVYFCFDPAVVPITENFSNSMVLNPLVLVPVYSMHPPSPTPYRPCLVSMPGAVLSLTKRSPFIPLGTIVTESTPNFSLFPPHWKKHRLNWRMRERHEMKQNA